MLNTMDAKEGRILNGINRTPGPTYQDIRKEDPVPGPDEIYGENPAHVAVGQKFSVPNSVFFSDSSLSICSSTK